MHFSNPFSNLRDTFEPLIQSERLLLGMFAATAITGTISPVLFPHQPKEVKLIQNIWGLFSSVCFSAESYRRQRKEKTYASIDDANHAIVKEQLKATFTFEKASQEIAAKRQLAAFVNNLPIEERGRWMTQYGLQGLVEIPQIQNAVIEPKQLTGDSTDSIPNPDIADVNEEVVQQIINPDVMTKIRQLAEQFPTYIRVDPSWIDELCDSSSLQNMSDRANHHFMLVGGTQSGKSTLAGVIINKIAAKSESPAIVIGSDPKDTITRWLCKFSRRFDGMGALNDWIKFATEVVDQRKAEIGSKGSTNGVAELFLIQDEVDTCYGSGKGFPGRITKETASALQALWNYIAKFTGGMKCHGIFIGQSPLSEATGFSRPNLKNLCFIALGQLSSYILGNPKDFLNVKPELIETLKQLCEMLDDSGARYALVVPTRSKPFIALIPTFDIDSMETKKQTPYQALETRLNELGDREPTDEEIKSFWLEITGEKLTDNAVDLLKKKLGLI